ncbi:hypothetical protein BU23DRAFT_151298 [Bimuria novae-zelandiae CBS 107.79]|uniref:Uncharacterized protein n=1 Tax=Bimuria novae-zelandiae CBS 107.79 TaxID=1447943 RepID=A0A6A5VRR5_9PLEO|nr:hypothetical protein BU23DRAFT_151298 [Bimuria novae-zelandiae CBS 107.79]
MPCSSYVMHSHSENIKHRTRASPQSPNPHNQIYSASPRVAASLRLPLLSSVIGYTPNLVSSTLPLPKPPTPQIHKQHRLRTHQPHPSPLTPSLGTLTPPSLNPYPLPQTPTSSAPPFKAGGAVYFRYGPLYGG